MTAVSHLLLCLELVAAAADRLPACQPANEQTVCCDSDRHIHDFIYLFRSSMNASGVGRGGGDCMAQQRTYSTVVSNICQHICEQLRVENAKGMIVLPGPGKIFAFY